MPFRSRPCPPLPSPLSSLPSSSDLSLSSPPAPAQRRAVPAAAALVVATAVVLLTSCGGGSGGSTSAPDDANAGCAALARTKADLPKPAVVDLKRLSAAANLGTAAASESKKYVVLAAPMNNVLADIQASDTAKLQTDVRAALSVCSDLKLPH
ncbi:MAG: hypothetical protein ACQSGP_03275 [Frankia sp.]